MHIQSLGHIVLKVRDLRRAEEFYHGILGIPISARAPQWNMIFFTLGKHHDLAVIEVDGDVSDSPPAGPGMDHLAFKIGDTLDQLRDAKAHLETHGVAVAPIDHGVTQSLYFSDPDGTRLEVYVDTTAAWQEDPSLILTEAQGLDL